MNPLIIEPTDETPKVVLDPANNVFEFVGKSLPEDVTTFYNPVLKWFDEYGNSPNAAARVDFKLIYFNTASSKLILDILFKLEELTEKGVNIGVNWHYQSDDEDMKEAGKEYGELVSVDFELKNF